MPNPNSYALNIPDPTQSVLAGVQGGANMANTLTSSQWAKDDRATAQAVAQAAYAKQKALEQQLAEVSKDPTADKINQMMIAHPGLSESLKAVHGNISTQESTAAVNAMSPIFAAYQNKQPSIARDLLVQQYNAAKNSQDYKKSTAIETLLKLHDADPAAAQASIGVRLGTLGGLDKFATVAETLAKTPAEVAKLGGEISKLGAETRKTGEEADMVKPLARAEISYKKGQTEQGWKKLAIDEDTLASNTALRLKEITDKYGELPEGTLKVVNTASEAAIKAGGQSKQAFDLANQFTAADASGGIRRSNMEWIKETIGGQDEVSAMRTNYKRLRNNAVISNLPKGSASDRDIEIAMGGFPGENANTSQITGFLRGMAKMSAIEEATEAAKAEWGGAVKHLGKTPKDIEIMGVQVPKGTTFSEFVKKNSERFAGDTLKRFETESNNKSVDNLEAKYGGGQ